jgi:hypothetical protein
MTLTDSVLQLTAHPFLLRLVLVVIAVAFFVALSAITNRLFESSRLFESKTENEELREKSRTVINVAHFW